MNMKRQNDIILQWRSEQVDDSVSEITNLVI